MKLQVMDEASSQTRSFSIKEYGIYIPSDQNVRQHQLGQFRTPEHVAALMAQMVASKKQHLRLLDAGAGDGTLMLALVRELCGRKKKPVSLQAVFFEIDANKMSSLEQTVALCGNLCHEIGIEFTSEIFNADFIRSSVPLVREDLYSKPNPSQYDVAIVNPPYRKIKSYSEERSLLRKAGIETVNLYAAFVGLITKLLAPDGELVAITPRSFANGPYFLSFRKQFLASMSLQRLHLFESRRAAFHSQEVLQENVIFHAVKNGHKSRFVTVSASNGSETGGIASRRVPYSDVVRPDDRDSFIHFDIRPEHQDAANRMQHVPSSLAKLGINVSTGRVVEFRAKRYLSPGHSDAMPLIHASHFSNGFVEWPKARSKRPSTIRSCAETADLLLNADTYVLVKRFTSKEERRRVVACLLDPTRFKAEKVGIENHLNYFHLNGKGLPKTLATGLVAYLNSTLVDLYFRQFSGHTQVNASDLRKLNYPSAETLRRLGEAIGSRSLSQDEIDALIANELWGNQNQTRADASLKRVN